MFSAILIVLGLTVFEIVCSIDNAVINAEVLSTMGKRGRRWFLLWGFLFAVVAVRGLLPWIIVWAVKPELGFIGALTATFSNDPVVQGALKASSPVLLAGAGGFLGSLFVHWLIREEKNIGFIHEKVILRNKQWLFPTTVTTLMGIATWAFWGSNAALIALYLGVFLFAIIYQVKKGMERREQEVMHSKGKSSDVRKIVYLEAIDSMFSIDAVVGALAFTLSVPLILIGNGIGALVVRYMTVRNIKAVRRYRYLKSGAMYSLAVLSAIMILHALGIHVPEWVAPVATLSIVGTSVLRS